MSATLESRPVWKEIQPLLASESIPALAQRFHVRAGEIAEAIKRSGVQRKPVTSPGGEAEAPQAAPPAKKKESSKAPAKAPTVKAAAPAEKSGGASPSVRKESKVAPFRHLLGQQTDGAIAKLAGVVAETVRMYRVRQGIPAVAQDAAAAKAPATSRDDLPPEPEAPKKRGPGRPRKERPAEAEKAEAPARAREPKPKAPATDSASSAATSAVPARRGVPSPIDAHVHLLGTMTDADLADQIGVSRGAVYQYRRHRKIPAFLPKPQKAGEEAEAAPAPAAAPARAPAPVSAAPAPAPAAARATSAPKQAAAAPRAMWAYTVLVRRGESESTYAVIGKDVADAASRAVGAVGDGEVLSITRYLESLS